MHNFSFQCCFCIKGIEETIDDPIYINIMFNEDAKKNDVGASANLFGHFECMAVSFFDLKNYKTNIIDSKFTCCFCYQRIEENRSNPVEIIFAFNDDYKQKKEACTIYVHNYCLYPKLHTDYRGYVDVLDYELHPEY